MKLPGEKRKRLKLQNTLFVPDLSYNLLSVSKASEAGMTTVASLVVGLSIVMAR